MACSSVPHIPFIERYAVAHEEGTIFLLKCLFAVMFFLLLNVLLQCRKIGRTYGEDAISVLPGKLP